jgi:subtilisin family serine protease
MDDGDYTDSFGGTSSACPVLAGVAGLVMSARKDMSAADALELLEKTTRAAPYAEPDSRGHDKTYGFGIVDPAAALRMALGVKEEPDADMTASTADDSGGCAVTTARADAVMLLGFLLSLWSLLRRRHAR